MMIPVMFILSCGDEESVTTEGAPDIPVPLDSAVYTQPDYAQIPAQITLQDISGKAFSFAPDLDTAILESYGECDCCTDDFLFVDDSTFIRISYCMADQTIFTGTYTVSTSELTLSYDTTIVNRTYDEEMQNAAIATGESLYTNETGYIKPVSETFTAWKCKNSFFLLAEYDQLYYGTADLGTIVKNEIDFLRADGVWDLISLAENNTN